MADLLREDWFHSISNRTTTRRFSAGDIMTLQGESSDYVGYILSGRARAVSYSEDGTATWVGYFSPDDFFGHMSLLTELPVNFEITAETDMKVIIVSVKIMQDLLFESTELSQVLATDLAVRLDMMTRRLVEAYTLSAKGRVCAELARLSNVIGIMPEKNIIRPNPVFVDLAMRVNSTRETVSRTVSELQKKGIISRETGALIIEKPDRLKAAIQ